MKKRSMPPPLPSRRQVGRNNLKNASGLWWVTNSNSISPSLMPTHVTTDTHTHTHTHRDDLPGSLKWATINSRLGKAGGQEGGEKVKWRDQEWGDRRIKTWRGLCWRNGGNTHLKNGHHSSCRQLRDSPHVLLKHLNGDRSAVNSCCWTTAPSHRKNAGDA